MKKLISILLLGFLFTGLTATYTHAQTDVSWNNPADVFITYPEIVLEVFNGFNIPNNAGGNLPKFENLDGQNCATSEGSDFYFQHAEAIDFINGYNEELEIAKNPVEGLIILDQRQVVYRNLNIKILIVNLSPYTDVTQFGTMELVPGSGEYFGFRILDTCVSSFGNHMPNVEVVLKIFVDTIYNYGYASQENPSNNNFTSEEEPIYVSPTDDSSSGNTGDLLNEEYDLITKEENQGRIPPKGFSGLMTGVAVAGALAGTTLINLIGLIGIGKNITVKASPPKMPVYYSLATGKPAPLAQVQQEQQLMNAGLYYRDGQWHAPSGEYHAGPSILSIEYQQEKAVRQEGREQQWAQEDAARKKENIKFDMEISEGQARQHMITVKQKGYQILGAKAVEWVADASIAASARFVPGGMVFQKWYERIKIAAKGVATGIAEESPAAALESIAKDVTFNKIANKIPSFVPKPKRAAFLAKHGYNTYKAVSSAGRSLQNSANSEGMDFVYEGGKKIIIKRLVTGR
jgi:hypothetical protein